MKNMSDKPPCSKCPYKLGIIKATVNPCPQCKLNGYSAYKHFITNMQKGTKHED